MKQYILGYKVKSPLSNSEELSTFGLSTHLGTPYLSENTLNVYFGKNNKQLQKNFADALLYVTGRRFFQKTDTSIAKAWRGGKVFITKVGSPKCEFKLSPKEGMLVITPSDFTETVCLRCPYKLKKENPPKKNV